MESAIPLGEHAGQRVVRIRTPFDRLRGSRSRTNLIRKKQKRKTRKLRHAPVAEKTRFKVGVSAILQELRAIVISLERRPDRMQACAARLAKFCPWLQYAPFPASDGRKDVISPEDVTLNWHTGKNVVYQKIRAVRKGWDDLDTYVVKQLSHSPGERGCSSSHIRAWRHCLDHCAPDGPILVLEDDASPTEDFTSVLEGALAALPEDAHVLYLGYSQAANWKRDISPNLVESEYVWTTVGYMIWPAGARILLNRLPIDQPVDNWMATACAEGALKSYCVRPKVIHQADAWNVNSDVGHSDEMYWGPCSDIRHSDALYWGPELEGHATRNAELASEEHNTILFGVDCSSDDSEDGMD